MRRWMICLICLVCFSLGSRTLAQDYKEELAINVVRLYTTKSFEPELDSLVVPNFWDESSLCSDTPPTEFEVLPLSDDPSRILPVGMLERIGTDRGVMYVLLTDIDRAGTTVQSVVCEDSPAGQALKMLVSDKFYCWQDIPPDTLIEGQWTNREGTRTLIRLRMVAWGIDVFVYLKKEGESWTYEKHLCGGPEAAALSVIIEYMYDFQGDNHYTSISAPRPFYYLGSSDAPVFADVTSVRGGYETAQATVLIQLETFDEYQEEGQKQDDPVCMLKLRNDVWWVVYEMRCTLN